MDLNLLILIYLGIINLFTFLLYAYDKMKAKVGAYRIPERILFLFPILGGGLGAFLGMQLFRHKTKHWYFNWGIPIIMGINIALFCYLYFYILKA